MTTHVGTAAKGSGKARTGRTTTTTVTLAVVVVSDSPPRFGITATAIGADRVTITRVVNGQREGVVGARDVIVSGSTYVEDFNAPFGVNVSYVATARTGNVVSQESLPTTALQIQTTQVWISDPTVPKSDLVAFPLIESWQTKNHHTTNQVVYTQGATRGILLAGTRRAPTFGYSTYVTSYAARDLMISLFRAAGVVLLRMPASLGQTSGYYSAADITETFYEPTFIQFDFPMEQVNPYRFSLALGTPGRTYADETPAYTNYADLSAKKATYLDEQRNPLP